MKLSKKNQCIQISLELLIRRSPLCKSNNTSPNKKREKMKMVLNGHGPPRNVEENDIVDYTTKKHCNKMSSNQAR